MSNGLNWFSGKLEIDFADGGKEIRHGISTQEATQVIQNHVARGRIIKSAIYYPVPCNWA